MDARAGQERGDRTGASDGTVTVLAAASLTEAFEALAVSFEAAHPGTRVVLGLGGSSGLARQILAGAPADVFAAASAEVMSVVVDQGAVVGEPVVFARNHMTIAVPAGNPGDVEDLADLADPRLRVALCAPEVPCGATAARLFAAAGIVPAADTMERDVRAVLATVRLGEVDAAVVYRTDVRAAAHEVDRIAVDGAAAAAQDYLLAVLADARNPAAARDFVGLAASASGRAVLARAGFELP